MSQRPYKRRIKLIKPTLQLKLTGIFAGISVLAFLLQALLLSWHLAELAAHMPSDGPLLSREVPTQLARSLVVSMAVLLPVTFGVGVLITFRIAGPVYRFEQYLGAIARGEEVGPCRLRDGDELSELCTALNQASAPLQAAHRHEREDSSHPTEHQDAGPEADTEPGIDVDRRAA